MDWLGVNVDSVMGIVYETCNAINEEINNIYLPTANEDDLLPVTADWAGIQEARYGMQLIPGVILAGDGFIIPIVQPDNVENPFIFRNRHDCFALVAQVFCDAYCRFRIFDVKWPGATNDITAYTQTTLHYKMQNNMLPSWACILMDGICSSVGDNHLTPFSRAELDRAKKQANHTLYHKMLTFNHVISSLRVTIESALGQLVRRFGILWKKPFFTHYESVSLLVTTCSKLHNICVERWLLKGKPGAGVMDLSSMNTLIYKECQVQTLLMR